MKIYLKINHYMLLIMESKITCEKAVLEEN